ncbi:MAG: hypothetical protein JJ863_30470 [Deltaproteobacteria bacterium]|nr:hypothetical protein [Deltaproteobacteria bacterium]
MASIKKRLKNIEKALQGFAAGEKRIVDLIVGLVAEHVERRVAERFEVRLAEATHEIIEELGRRFPEREDVQQLVEESVLHALRRHEDERRNEEERFAQGVARAVELARKNE